MTQIQQYSYRVSDAEQTRELGEQLAHHLRAGDLIRLRGGLGAGKTTFTQGIGRGLQVRGTVASRPSLSRAFTPRWSEDPTSSTLMPIEFATSMIWRLSIWIQLLIRP